MSVKLFGAIVISGDDPEGIFRLRLAEASYGKLKMMTLEGANPILKAQKAYHIKIKATKAVPIEVIRAHEGEGVGISARIRRYKFPTDSGIISGWSLTATEINV